MIYKFFSNLSKTFLIFIINEVLLHEHETLEKRKLQKYRVDHGITFGIGRLTGSPTRKYSSIEIFYLNTIKQLFLFVEQLDQLEAGITILALFLLRWNSNKTFLPNFIKPKFYPFWLNLLSVVSYLLLCR